MSSPADPFAPLRTLTAEQRESLLLLTLLTAATAATFTRCLDTIGLEVPADAIVHDVVSAVTEVLDETT